MGTAKGHWRELPLEIMWMILSRLGAEELLGTAQFVCRSWRAFCRDPLRWRLVRLKGSPYRMDYHYNDCRNRFCRLAVDLSRRSLESISICAFATDKLLQYVAFGTNNLKQLRLVQCWRVTNKGLVSIAAQVPSLEELELSNCFGVSGRGVEALALNCPLLVSFKYNHTKEALRNSRPIAYVIARSMPGLVHLEMRGNYWLRNHDLRAVLEGCPCLESLDLRRCSLLDLDGELGLRCAEQIKDLWHPCDPDDGLDADYYSDGYMDFYKEYFQDDDDDDYYFQDYDNDYDDIIRLS